VILSVFNGILAESQFYKFQPVVGQNVAQHVTHFQCHKVRYWNRNKLRRGLFDLAQIWHRVWWRHGQYTTDVQGQRVTGQGHRIKSQGHSI